MDADIIQGPDCVRGHRQIQDSKGQIEKQKRETWEEVTKIRTRADDAENERRFKKEKRRNDRYQIIKNETIQSSKKNEAAEFKWADLLELEQCEELYERIQEQKKECEEIIGSKQRLIDEFTDELKEEDGFYVKSIRQMEEDIDKLIDLMRRQYESMRLNYSDQLDQIEETFLAERAELLKANKEEIDSLFERHKELEANFTSQRQQLEEGFADELDKIRADEASDFHDHKIRLETDLQIIEKCLEEMKAIYQLNLEKLGYNVKILEERVNENGTTLNLLNKRKQNLKNKLIKLKEKCSKNEQEYNKKNIKLTEQFKRVSQAFNKLRRQFRHFEKADTARFNEIWEMNESEVRELANKVLKCDRIIYEQQLGLNWSVPEDPTLNLDYQSGAQPAGSQGDVESSKHGQSSSINKIREVFTLLAIECDFLLEDKVKEQCLGKKEREQLPIKIDSIRKTLNIESMEDINLLVNLFYNKAEDMDISGDGEFLNVDPTQVVDILFEYQDLRTEKKGYSASKFNEPNATSMKSWSADNEKEMKEKVIQDERKHWEKMGSILPENHQRVWKALERAFNQYYSLLTDRQNLVEETGILHQQNEELKSLLNQYLQAGVNQELHIPPTQMIRLEEEENL